MGNLARFAEGEGIEMNREQVIAIAKSVDVRALETSDGGLGGIVEPLRTFHMSEIQLERFAALVASAEREACAQACEEISDDYMQSESRLYPEMKTDAQAGASDCEAAIRARNTNKETK